MQKMKKLMSLIVAVAMLFTVMGAMTASAAAGATFTLTGATTIGPGAGETVNLKVVVSGDDAANLSSFRAKVIYDTALVTYNNDLAATGGVDGGDNTYLNDINTLTAGEIYFIFGPVTSGDSVLDLEDVVVTLSFTTKATVIDDVIGFTLDVDQAATGNGDAGHMIDPVDGSTFDVTVEDATPAVGNIESDTLQVFVYENIDLDDPINENVIGGVEPYMVISEVVDQLTVTGGTLHVFFEDGDEIDALDFDDEEITNGMLFEVQNAAGDCLYHATLILFSDVNCSGGVSMADALAVPPMVTSGSYDKWYSWVAADINFSQDLTMSDALKIVQQITNYNITEFDL